MVAALIADGFVVAVLIVGGLGALLLPRIVDSQIIREGERRTGETIRSSLDHRQNRAFMASPAKRNHPERKAFLRQQK